MMYSPGFYTLKQTGYLILQEIDKIGGLTGLYRLGKPFLSTQDQRDLNVLEHALGSLVDPLYNARNAFIQWNAQCDLELNNYKRTDQMRTFEQEKKSVLKLFEKRKLDHSILSSKMKSVLLALEVLEQTAIRKDVRPLESIPTGAIEVITVEKDQPYTALKRVEGIFQNAISYVKIMDNWIGAHTLDFVLSIPLQVPVMILTSNIEKKSKAKFEVGFQRIQKERRAPVDIHVCPPSKFHDRYIITGNELWQSGPSLKDLGITSWGTVSKIGNPATKTEIEKKFDELWKSGKQPSL